MHTNHSIICFRKITGRHPVILLTILLMLVSGSTIAYYDFKPAMYTLPPGTTLVLSQDLEVPDGARIHVQNGVVQPFSELRTLDPYCYFYSRRDGQYLDQPFKVQKGEFPIGKVQQRRFQAAIRVQQYANLGYFGSRGGVQMILATELTLQTPQQPDLDSLICAIFADPRERNHLDFNEIQKSLGNVASFNVP